MTLIVEDGTGVTGADTYVSLADARTRATTLGVSISSTDGTAELQLQQATLYIDRTYRQQFQGVKLEVDQPLQFPRTPVVVDNILLDSDGIPQELIDAEIYAAAQLESGESFYTNQEGKNIKLEEITGAIKQEYFNNGRSSTQVIFSNIEETIKPLLGQGSMGKYSYSVRR